MNKERVNASNDDVVELIRTIDRDKAKIPYILSILKRFMDEWRRGDPILYPRCKIAYMPLAKVGQTSCREFFFQLRSGIEWSDASRILYTHREWICHLYSDGVLNFADKKLDISKIISLLSNKSVPGMAKMSTHQYLGVLPTEIVNERLAKLKFEQEYNTYALIRNPVDRIVSNWKYFVLVRKEFERIADQGEDINPTPSLDELVANWPEYEALSIQYRDKKGLAAHMLPQKDRVGDQSTYTNIYRLENIANFFNQINEISDVQVPHRHVNSSSGDNVRLSAAVRKWATNKYSGDFDLYEKAC